MEQKFFLKYLLNTRYILLVLFVVFDIIFISFISYLGYQIFGIYQEARTLEQEIDQLKADALLIKNNKEMLQDSIEQYNDTLDDLIPDGETYFKVISALERLESRIGINIKSYTINLNETTDEKLSLSLSINGSQEAIETFLGNYHYFGGRLLTNEEMSYSFEDPENINFTVNLYHAAEQSTTSSIETKSIIISNEDLELMKSIEDRL